MGQDWFFLLSPSSQHTPPLLPRTGVQTVCSPRPLQSGRCPAQAWMLEGLSILRRGSTCTALGPATASLPLPSYVWNSLLRPPHLPLPLIPWPHQSTPGKDHASSLWLRQP